MWWRRERTASRPWKLIEEHHPDLVFLDVQMPGLDGFAVIQRVMERHRKQKDSDGWPLPQFVFATAYDQYAVRAFDVNAVDYLLKPFDRVRVDKALERVRGRMTNGAGGGKWRRRVADRVATGCAAESAEESAGRGARGAAGQADCAGGKQAAAGGPGGYLLCGD